MGKFFFERWNRDGKRKRGWIFLLPLMVLLLIFPVIARAAQLEMDEQEGAKGNEVSFSVSANNTPTSASTFFIDISFDPMALQYKTANFSGSLIGDFDVKEVSNPEPGILRIYGTVGHVWQSVTIGATGIFVKITFKVIADEDCKVSFKRMIGDVASWSTKNGSFKIIKNSP